MSFGPMWPTQPPSVDPFALAPAVATHKDHARNASLGDATAEFLELCDAVRAGAQPLEALSVAAAHADVLGRVFHDTRTCPLEVEPASVEVLARIAADFCPTASELAIDLALGPWAAALDARTPAGRHVALSAMALFSLTEAEPPARPPSERWRNRKPRYASRIRNPVSALLWVPTSAWRLTAPAGNDAWIVQDITGLHERWHPDGPVRLDRPASVTGHRPAVDDTLFARVLHGASGWTAAVPFLIPGRIPRAAIRAWLRLLLLESRVQKRGLRLEALLARRGTELVRRAHEWHWSQR